MLLSLVLDEGSLWPVPVSAVATDKGELTGVFPLVDNQLLGRVERRKARRTTVSFINVVAPEIAMPVYKNVPWLES